MLLLLPVTLCPSNTEHSLVKHILAPLGIALAFAASPAISAELSLDEVIEQNIEARGGYESIKDVQSARMTGQVNMGGGMIAPFTMEFKRGEEDNKMRMEFHVQGMTGIQAYDGEKGWMVMPFMGKTAPEEMSDADLKDVKQNADFDGPLVDYSDKGNTVELLGVEEIEGTQAYKLKITRPGGDESIAYIDSEFMLEIKQTSTTDRNGVEMTVHTSIGDYKEVGDLILPHSMDISFEGVPITQNLTIESVELNPELDDNRFMMPATETAE